MLKKSRLLRRRGQGAALSFCKSFLSCKVIALALVYTYIYAHSNLLKYKATFQLKGFCYFQLILALLLKLCSYVCSIFFLCYILPLALKETHIKYFQCEIGFSVTSFRVQFLRAGMLFKYKSAQLY